jgi:hypothetical protein
MQKRGQFFLIAAVVIVGVMFGLTTVYNHIQSPSEDTTVYDLSKEISFETAKVIDNGVFLSDTNTLEKIENLTDFYSATNPKTDLIIIYGNEEIITVIFYNRTQTGSIGIEVGSTVSTTPTEQTFKQKSEEISYPDPREVSIELGFGIPFNFTLRQGQIFYLVLKKETLGERFVAGPTEPSI